MFSSTSIRFHSVCFFNNNKDGQDKGSQDQLGSSVDLESSIDDAISLKAVKISRGSESNLSGSELEANYASSNEDILSSKDSLNSIPSVRVKFSISSSEMLIMNLNILFEISERSFENANVS